MATLTRPSGLTRCAAYALPLIMASLMSGCGMVLTGKAKLFHESNEPTPISTLKQDRMANVVADEFGLMALFAHIVYRQDLKAEEAADAACDYLLPGAEVDHYGMPSGGATPRQWMRWIPGPDDPKDLQPCFNDQGLFYETYVYPDADGKPEEVIIAFRGTENIKGQFFSDWKANLSAVFGIEPIQYEISRKTIPPVIQALTKKNPAVRIYAVGHSLGGGLAQQAGYRNIEIAKVFTFNTSPVTNWTHLRLNDEVENEYPTIYRLYHSGEVLEKIRFFTTNFTTTRFRRYDLGMQFMTRSNLKGHAMEILACTFAALVANGKERTGDAAHFYSRDYAKNHVLTNSNMCGKGYSDLIHEDHI